MAYPVIRINNVTGSDTQASGAGPDPAIYGMQAATDSAGTTVDLSLDNPDLSGVATDGSHVIWLGGTGGREFSKITGVDNTAKTITVSSPFPSNLSGVNWAIGGKRKSINSALVGDLEDLWSINLEYTGQDYVYDGNIYPPNDVRCIIFGSGQNRPKLTNSSNTYLILSSSTGHITFKYLELESYNSASYEAVRISSPPQGGSFSFVDCYIVAVYSTSVYNRFYVNFSNCHIVPKSNWGYFDRAIYIYYDSPSLTVTINDSFVNSNSEAIAFNGGTMYIKGSIIKTPDSGVKSSNNYQYKCKISVFNSVFDCGGYGIVIYDYYELFSLEVYNSVFFGNYMGIYAKAAPGIIKNCAFGSNTAGNYDVYSPPMIIEGTTILTEDPFVDRINGNYALNDAPGGGQLLKDAGWPQTWPGLPNTTSYPDIGAVESQAGAGSSSGPPIPIPVPTRRGWI